LSNVVNLIEAMKFFFPDSHDLVDPSFDFITERRSFSGSRQQAQQYAHEVLNEPPYDGMLLSKAMVDPHCKTKSVRYSFAQVQRLKRLGVREFLRLERPGLKRRIDTMGDCGSFSYVTEPEPPYGVESVIEFYLDCKFDYGISLDHVILGFKDAAVAAVGVPPDWRARFEITLEKAREFLKRQRDDKLPFVPLGAAQGWSADSYKEAVNSLQKMGYDYIALGGMVPLKTSEILASLEAIKMVRRPSTKLHLLGISRLENLEAFERYGVYSFDSTSPLKRAFMDDKDNYHTPNRTYTAVRIPQVEGNAQLKKLILSGEVDFANARKLELRCLEGALAYESGKVHLDELLEHLRQYEAVWHGTKDDTAGYRQTLQDKPWKQCPCAICRQLGIHVVLFRGAERNRRRGFHNLYVLRQRLDKAAIM
jgi:hypothetical protein